MGRDSHALSAPAERSALEVLAANGVETRVQQGGGLTPTPAVSRAILVYNRGRGDGGCGQADAGRFEERATFHGYLSLARLALVVGKAVAPAVVDRPYRRQSPPAKQKKPASPCARPFTDLQ